MTEPGDVTVGVAVPLDGLERIAARVWWILLVAGIVSMGFGLLLVFRVADSAKAIAVLVGVYLAITGVIEIVRSGSARHRGWAILGGLLLLGGGLITAFWPGVTLRAIAVVFGLTLLVVGGVRFLAALGDDAPGRGWRITLAALTIVVGAISVVWPNVTIAIVTFVVGVYALIAGVLWIVLAFQARATAKALRAA